MQRYLVTGIFSEGAKSFVVKDSAELKRIVAKCSIIENMAPYELTPLTHALTHFANDWHSGQGSKGYKLLNYAIRRANRQGTLRPLDVPMNDDAQAVYDTLAIRYRYKV